jgi:hypothetical protein
MATAKPDTGHGATLTLSASTGAYKIRKIVGLKASIPVVNISHLGTTGQQETMPGDLEELDELQIEIVFEAVLGLPATGVVETVTVTFPLQSSGASTAANLAGTGYITSRKFPDLETNTEMIGMITIKYDGATGPAYTVAS